VIPITVPRDLQDQTSGAATIGGPPRASVDPPRPAPATAYRDGVPLRRALALLVASLASVVALATGLVLAGPAAASAPAAPLEAVPNADGSRSLHWTLAGSSDSVNVLPHLRCAVDPAASGPFAGSRVPCVWLVDHRAPAAAAPEGCPATANPYASWRCDMRRFRDLVIDAAATGERSVIQFNTKAKGGSGVCAWIPVAVRLGGGTGTLEAGDGCPERISCAAGFAGTVRADATLDVVAGCRRVTRVGAGAPTGTTPGSSPTTTGVADLTTCPGYGEGQGGESPLWDVRTTKRGRRGMYVRVTMRRAVPITVQIRRRTARGTALVRAVNVCAKAGPNRLTVKDATGGVRGRRRYRVVVTSPVSKYPLVSSYETLPR
jgi:hypothetical protein